MKKLTSLLFAVLFTASAHAQQLSGGLPPPASLTWTPTFSCLAGGGSVTAAGTQLNAVRTFLPGRNRVDYNIQIGVTVVTGTCTYMQFTFPTTPGLTATPGVFYNASTGTTGVISVNSSNGVLEDAAHTGLTAVNTYIATGFYFE